MLIQNKVCIDCKIEKSYKEFYRKSDKLSKRCKLCEAIWKARPKTKEELCWSAICSRINKNKQNSIKFQKRTKELEQVFIPVEMLRRFISFIFKPIILYRDSHCCQLCQGNENLELHHIIPIKQDSKPENIVNPNNLIILCQFCHLYKAHLGCYRNINEDIKLNLLKIAKSRKHLIKDKIWDRVNSLLGK